MSVIFNTVSTEDVLFLKEILVNLSNTETPFPKGLLKHYGVSAKLRVQEEFSEPLVWAQHGVSSCTFPCS